VTSWYRAGNKKEKQTQSIGRKERRRRGGVIDETPWTTKRGPKLVVRVPGCMIANGERLKGKAVPGRTQAPAHRGGKTNAEKASAKDQK